MQTIESTIASLVVRLVGTSVARDAPLMEAGIDSLASSELVQGIKDDLSAELSATLLFDHPSIVSIFNQSFINLHWFGSMNHFMTPLVTDLPFFNLKVCNMAFNTSILVVMDPWNTSVDYAVTS